jgi:co-chaperonin GroES (HSP10)
MITVVGCRILLRPFKMEESDKVWARAKAMGIEIPELADRKAKANIDKGEVLQIGDKCHEDYVSDLKVGDIIGFAKFGGKFIEDPDKEGEFFLVINDEDVICILKKE